MNVYKIPIFTIFKRPLFEVDVIFLFAGGRGGHLYAIIYTDYNKPHMIKHYKKNIYFSMVVLILQINLIIFFL